MDSTLKGLVLVTLCIILLLLFLRFMFNENFRKDLIAGDSETKIFGVLSVQGALMAVLALGLVGGMITVLKWGDSANGSSTSNAAISFDPRSWYAIDINGKPIDTYVTLGSEKKPLGLPISSIQDSILFETTFGLTEKADDIWITKNNLLWGKINETKKSGLFSDFFVTDDNELPVNYFQEFTFVKKKGVWPEAHNFFSHFQIAISEKKAKKPKYVISDLKTGAVVYDSKGNQEDFGVYQDAILSRKFHIFKSENNFFLFRINSVVSLYAAANDTTTVPSIKFMAVKLKVE